MEIINEGAETAAAVDIAGYPGNEPPSTATVDYVPGHGRATAWMRFGNDPRKGAVKVVGWSEP